MSFLLAAIEVPTNAARWANAGTLIWNVASVLVIRSGLEKVLPPSIDLTKNRFLLPVSGQTAKTLPASLVEILLPMAVPVVSRPLTRRGASQPAAVRRPINAGRPLCQTT